MRILRAAREAFAAKGYHGATMTEIAEASGLAVQTVSYFFGTKPRLLGELIGAAVTGALEDAPADPATSDWFAHATTAPDGRTALDSLVDGGLSVFARAAAVADVARVAALTDPDVEEVYRTSEDRRHADFRRVIQGLADHGTLREDLTVDHATDVLTTVLSPATYLAYTRERGWSDDRLAGWLKDALPRLLLAP
jgi:AcrR family transcriptional regulator